MPSTSKVRRYSRDLSKDTLKCQTKESFASFLSDRDTHRKELKTQASLPLEFKSQPSTMSISRGKSWLELDNQNEKLHFVNTLLSEEEECFTREESCMNFAAEALDSLPSSIITEASKILLDPIVTLKI